MADRWQLVSSLTAVRSKWPRNFTFFKPKSNRKYIRLKSVPSNILYGRPRTIDRSLLPHFMGDALEMRQQRLTMAKFTGRNVYEPEPNPDGSYNIEPPGGPTVVELEPTSTEPPIPPEPPKRPADYEDLYVEFGGYDEGTFNCYVTFGGGMPPYLVDWGDGTSASDVEPGEIEHEYQQAGSYIVTVSDCDVPPLEAVDTVVVEEPEPEVPPVEGEADWTRFKTHAQFEDYWTKEQLGEYPDGWLTMTIAQKKSWMDENLEP